MTRIVVIGDDATGLAAALSALGLDAIRMTEDFRDLVLAMPTMDVPAPFLPPAPKFGGDRAYLKKKKGRS
jgi:hypothetical protein